MRERRAVLLLVTGLALAALAGLGLAFDAGPKLGLTALALVGVVLALAAQQWMARLPGEGRDEP